MRNYGYLLLCIVSFTLFLFDASARAASYFVATNGNDLNDGLSTTSPWGPSLSNSINRIRGGDQLWVRGGEYRGRFSLTNNTGSVSNRIFIAAYSNETPVLKGSRIVDGWELFAGNIWMKTNWTHNSQQVFIDGEALQQLGWPNEYVSTNAFSCASWLYIPHGYSCANIDPVNGGIDVGNPLLSMTNGTFYCNTNTHVLYIQLKDNSSPVGRLVEVSVDLGVFYDQSDNGFVTVQGLTFRHASTLTLTAMGWPVVKLGPHGLMESCDVEWGDAIGLTLYEGGVVQNSRIANNGLSGIGCNFISNVVVRGCTIVSNNYRDFTLTWAGGIKIIPDSGGLIESNEVAWNWAVGIWFDTCYTGYPIVIRNNYVHDNCPHPNRLGDPSSYAAKGIFIEITKNAQVYNNLVVSNCNVGIHLSAAFGCRVYNNVIQGTRDTPGGYRGLYALQVDNPLPGRPVASNRFFNNIIIDNACWWDIATGVSDGTNLYANYYDFNCFYRDTGTGWFPTSHACLAAGELYPSLESWSGGTGWDSNSVCADPLLDACFSLMASSPCIDAGTTNVGGVVKTAKNGVPRPLDGNNDGIAAFDIGAYEFASSVSDTDHDGLSDASEAGDVETDPTIADCDSDTQLDGEEFIAGTDPWNSAAYFGVEERSSLTGASGFVVEWQSVTGRLYTVSSCTNLPVPAWTNLPGAVSLEGTGARLSVTNTMSEAVRKYYRVGVKRQ